MEPDRVNPETWAVVGGRPKPVPGAPVNAPLVAASTFVLGSERIYSRTAGAATYDARADVESS